MTERSPVRAERMVDMRSALRWLFVVAIALVVIGLAAYGRGQDHKRGDDVGALGAGVTAAQTHVRV
jgi:hypothetical protein